MRTRTWLAPGQLPIDWATALRDARQRDARRVAVVGEMDTGKSTFVSLLLNTWLETDSGVQLLDCDPGQKMIGPPACITLGSMRRQPAVDTLVRLAFIGTLSAADGARLLDATGKLIPNVGEERLVMNTSGFLEVASLDLTLANIGLVQPDLLIAIGPGSPCLELAHRSRIPFIKLDTPDSARKKSASARSAARQDAFRAYFASVSTFETDRALLRDASQAPPDRLEPGLVCALEDPKGNDIALAIVEEVGSTRIRLAAPRLGEVVHGLRPGSIRARWTEDGWELCS